MSEMEATLGNFHRTRLWRVLVVSWIGYAAYSMGRRPFSVARSVIVKDTGLTVAETGWIDTGFLATYTLAQLFYSQIQRYMDCSARNLLFYGLIGSCITQFMMTISTDFISFFVTAALNGTMQAVGWSTCVVVVTPWIAPAERGGVMGIWGTTVAVGGMFGNTLTPLFIEYSGGWRGGVQLVGLTMALVAALLYLALGQHPNAHGFLSPVQAAKGFESFQTVAEASMGRRSIDGEFLVDVDDTSGAKAAAAQQMTPTPRQLLEIPGVAGICLSQFFAKLVRYVLMFWLPFLLTDGLHYTTSTAGFISSALDLGGIAGTIGSGVFCDRFGKGKRRTFATMLICAGMIISLSGFSFGLGYASSPTYATFICFICGFCAYGIDMVLTGSLLQDVTDRQGVSQYVGGISGLVGSTGTLGAVLQGPVTVALSTLSWSGVFGSLQVIMVLSMASLYPNLRAENRARNKVSDPS